MTAPDCAPVPGLAITIDGAPIHYELHRSTGAAGYHNPLVFLHEGLGSIRQWRSFPGAVRHRLGGPAMLVYSRHGHGQSGLRARSTGVVDLRHEALTVLPQLLAELDIRAPVLIGHSDGASIAALYASAGHPVTGLVLIAPHVFVEQVTVRGIADATERYHAGPLRQALTRYHLDPDSMFGSWSRLWLDPAFRTWNIEEELARISAPIMTIQGVADQYGTLAQLDAIERCVPGPVRRLVLPDIGHTPHLEAPTLTVAAIAAFIRHRLASDGSAPSAGIELN